MRRRSQQRVRRSLFAADQKQTPDRFSVSGEGGGLGAEARPAAAHAAARAAGEEEEAREEEEGEREAGQDVAERVGGAAGSRSDAARPGFFYKIIRKIKALISNSIFKSPLSPEVWRARLRSAMRGLCITTSREAETFYRSAKKKAFGITLQDGLEKDGRNGTG